MQRRSNIFRGISALCVFLLIVSIMGTQIALNYSDSVDAFLGTSSTRVIEDEDADTDTTYYPTGLSSDDIQDVDTLNELESQVVDEIVAEMEESTTLMLNKNDALPLEKGSNITLLGAATVNVCYSRLDVDAMGGDIYTGWTQEGESAEISYVDAFSDVYNVNMDVIDAYQASANTYPGRGYQTDDSGNVTDAEAPASYYDSLSDSFSEYGDAAVIVLTRSCDEGSDLSQSGGVDGSSALALQPNEKELLEMVKTYKDQGVFNKVIVLLNTANAIEVGELEEYGADAIAWIGLPGSTGMTGVINVLSGDVSPSGHLTDTYAVSSLSAPAVLNAVDESGYWANAQEILDAVGYTTEGYSGEQNYTSYIVQAEDIYTGYKYYETRYEDTLLGQGNADSTAGAVASSNGWNYNEEVSYPFGYGLSYTSFSQTLHNVSYNSDTDKYEVEVTVTNTGDTYSGQAVAQVYAQTPYGDYERTNGVEKASVQLVGFAKTQELAPGESETLTVEVERYFLASYDKNAAKGYILSEGDYYLALGEDAHDALNNILAAKEVTGMTDVTGETASGNTDLVYNFKSDLDTAAYATSRVNEDVTVTNEFDTADLNYWIPDTVTYLSRSDWEGTYPVEYSKMELTADEEMIKELGGFYEVPEEYESISVDDFTQGAEGDYSFIMMMDVDFDDTETWDEFLNQFTVDELLTMIDCDSQAIDSLGIPAAAQIDDNIGIYTSFLAVEGTGQHWCSEPNTAATFNVERYEAKGRLEGLEAEFSGRNEIFYGGGNSHRTQFCGRNQQYYSEDGVLGYYVGMYEATGMQGIGVTYCVKHFAGNNQETNRESISTFMSEQAFRELELRSFEGCIVEGGALSVMDSFNRLGLTCACYSKPLNTTVLRDEWGFKGHVTTDAIAGSLYKQNWGSSITAGIDFYCFNNFIAMFGSDAPDALEAVGTLVDEGDGYVLQSLRRAAKSDVYALLHTYVSNGLSSTSRIESVTPWWQYALYVIDGAFGVIALISFVAFIVFSRKRKEEA